MPHRPPGICAKPGCSKVTHEKYCGKHKNETKQYDQRRGTAAQRGYGSRWQKARESFLKLNPLCCECDKVGKTVPATVVDHIRPHKQNQKLFWDRSNWQSLCASCHGRKTVLHDGGFGN